MTFVQPQMHTPQAVHTPAAPPQSPVPRTVPFKQVEVGRILTVGSSMAMVQISKQIIRKGQLNLVQLGTILKIVTSESIVVAMVSSLKIGAQDGEGMSDGCLARLDILGEITTNATTRQTKFFRGVRTFPVLNEPVYNMSADELTLIFATRADHSIHIGSLQQDKSIGAEVRTDDLLSKHFAIIGSTGSGKSCTVALVLRAILETNRNAHVVLFDPHNEYSKSFDGMSEVIRQDELDLPLWMFNFEETVELLASEIEDQAREEEEVLSELVLKAKQLFEISRASGDVSSQAKIEDLDKRLTRSGNHISLDSPVPYRIRDVLRLLDYEMGKLENNSNLAPYKRLKRRIEGYMSDPRYQFIFRNQAQPLPIAQIVGRIFRIPVVSKPISILDFSGIPSEALNVVVSVVSRLSFEIAMWSERQVPILLVCEEAHRYIPADHRLGFASTRKAISRIAKEGRKYGVSLAIISQRPSELEPSTLSQCSTIFSMRLSNELDQNFVRAAVPDGASELLSFLPSLGTAEAMVFGEAVNLPMRVILNTLAEDARPHSSSAKFTEVWAAPEQTPDFMQRVFANWRARKIGADMPATEPARQTASRPRTALRQTSPAARGATSQPRAGTAAPLGTPLGSLRQGLRAPVVAAPDIRADTRSTQNLSDVKTMLKTAFNRDL